jgi:hypothetical protein
MFNTQSNTHQGQIEVIAGDNLTGKEGYLVKVVDNAGTLNAYLPAAVTDEALFIVGEGAVAGALATLIPLVAGNQYRAYLGITTIVGGDKIVAYGGGAAGQAMEYAGSGAAFIVGCAEEVGNTLGAFTKFRAVLSHLTV